MKIKLNLNEPNKQIMMYINIKILKPYLNQLFWFPSSIRDSLYFMRQNN